MRTVVNQHGQAVAELMPSDLRDLAQQHIERLESQCATYQQTVYDYADLVETLRGRIKHLDPDAWV